MSRRRWRLSKLCANCQDWKARFRYRGRVKASLRSPTARWGRASAGQADRDQVLCFQCWRSEMDRSRARQLALPLSPVAPHSVRGDLNDRQLAHRARMLEHMTRSVKVRFGS
jgi:hypothetical protein